MHYLPIATKMVANNTTCFRQYAAESLNMICTDLLSGADGHAHRADYQYRPIDIA
jgi:hypothetical protein